MGVYRILALDGGGIRGLITAVILRRLEERVPVWMATVDLVAGTSTGGILALGLAQSLTPTDLETLYYDKCTKVFADTLLEGSTGLADYKCAQLLGDEQDRRINPILDDIINLDDCDRRDELVRIGESQEIEEIVAWLNTNWF